MCQKQSSSHFTTHGKVSAARWQDKIARLCMNLPPLPRKCTDRLCGPVLEGLCIVLSQARELREHAGAFLQSIAAGRRGGNATTQGSLALQSRPQSWTSLRGRAEKVRIRKRAGSTKGREDASSGPHAVRSGLRFLPIKWEWRRKRVPPACILHRALRERGPSRRMRRCEMQGRRSTASPRRVRCSIGVGASHRKDSGMMDATACRLAQHAELDVDVDAETELHARAVTQDWARGRRSVRLGATCLRDGALSGCHGGSRPGPRQKQDETGRRRTSCGACFERRRQSLVATLHRFPAVSARRGSRQTSIAAVGPPSALRCRCSRKKGQRRSRE